MIAAHPPASEMKQLAQLVAERVGVAVARGAATLVVSLVAAGATESGMGAEG